MSSIFGVQCETPPSFADVYFSTPLFPFSAFVKSIFQNPDKLLSKQAGFFHSKLFMTLYLWYVVFRIPRTMSIYLNKSIGLNLGILLVLNISFVFGLFQKYGYECTVFLSVILFLVYTGLVSMIPIAAESPIGEILPEIKALPASTRKSGVNHCRRLAVCRATPVYDNYLFQKGKHEKCIECAKMNEKIVFSSSKPGCGSKQKDIDAKKCYDCTVDSPPNFQKCTYDSEDCNDVKMILDMLDPQVNALTIEHQQGESRVVSKKSKNTFDRSKICRESHGSLCWFGKLQGGKYRGWNYSADSSSQNYRTYDLNDIQDAVNANQGFPTREVCQTIMKKTLGTASGDIPEDTCVKGFCDLSDKMASCACAQYRDVAQFKDPCKFLEENCDENSIAFTEAKLKIKQASVSMDDIVTTGDVKRLLDDIDDIARKIP